MEELLITSIFVIAIGYLMNWVNKYKNYGIELNERNGFKFLLGWLILGFFLRLDYSDNWGCVVGIAPFWELRNILFSAISIGLIYWAFKTENQNLKKILCLTELTFWISKLIIFKGGYVVGFGGTPDISIVFYDLVSAIARLFILSQIINIQSFKSFKIAFVALLIMGIKIEVFSTPIYMVYEENQSIEKAKEIRQEIIGTWKGDYQKLEYEKILKSDIAKIKIDSNSIFLTNIEGLESEYKLILEYSGYGRIYKEGVRSFEVSIEEYKTNSMMLRLDDFDNIYKFKLKKENEI
jgi:hypothetical protein